KKYRSQRALSCRGEFFLSKSWRWVFRRLKSFLGEIIGLCCRTGLSAVFSSCHVAALQPCETSRLGPPSRIADPGLFWAIHKLDTSQRVLLCREDRRSWNFLTGNGFGNRGW